MNLFRHPVVYLVCAMRLGGILLVPWYPLAGMLVSFFFDWLDSIILIQIVGYTRDEYQWLDKAIDHVWYTVMLIVSWATPYRWLLVALFVYRSVGYAIFLTTRNSRVFLLFPNLFEFAFFWFVAVPPNFRIFSDWGMFVLLSAVKCVQEYISHVVWPAKLDSYRLYGPPKLFQLLKWKNIG